MKLHGRHSPFAPRKRAAFFLTKILPISDVRPTTILGGLLPEEVNYFASIGMTPNGQTGQQITAYSPFGSTANQG
jgi:hypothetical protein